MLKLNSPHLRSRALPVTLALMAMVAYSPLQPVWGQSPAAQAQMRGLPDFTDLVDQVGPAVVNIRTLEKAKPGAGPGNEEQMLEFFRRFGIPVPPNMPRSPRPDRGAPPD